MKVLSPKCFCFVYLVVFEKKQKKLDRCKRDGSNVFSHAKKTKAKVLFIIFKLKLKQ